MINPSNILKVSVDYWSSQVLITAVELEIFTALADGPLSFEEIVEGFELKKRPAIDFLDALVALKFLEKKDSLYYNSDDSDYYLDKNKESYLGNVMGNDQYALWGNLLGFLQGTYEISNEQSRYEFYSKIYSSPEATDEYAKTMATLNMGDHTSIVEEVDWRKYHSVVDLGCSNGALLVKLLDSKPNLTGIGFELPQLKQAFDANICKYNLQERANFMAGNFLVDDIPEADVYIMGHIIHALSIHDRDTLLKKVYDKILENGCILIYEHMIDDERRFDAFSIMMSLNMQLGSNGFGSLTGEEFCELLCKIGFKENRVISLLGPSHLVIGEK